MGSTLKASYEADPAEAACNRASDSVLKAMALNALFEASLSSPSSSRCSSSALESDDGSSGDYVWRNFSVFAER